MTKGSIWRLGVLFASLVGHWLWFSQSEQQEKQMVIQGGTQQLPIAVSFSVASVAKPPVEAEQMPKPEAKPVEKPKVEKALVKTEPVLPKPVPKPVLRPATVEEILPEEVAEVHEPVAEQQDKDVDVAAEATTTEQQPPGLESIPVVRDVSYRRPPQPPIYPKTALRRRQQGEVWVQALVNPEGNTEQVEVVRSSGVASLDASALQAVSGWVFEAAKMDGRPIRAWIEVPVAFELRR